MKRLILFIICLGAAVATPGQPPLSASDALKELYKDYNPDTGKARLECVKGKERDSAPQKTGWPCLKEYATVRVSSVFMAEVMEHGTDRVYLVASAVPADSPGGFECHACQTAIGVAVFQAQEGNWALRSANAAVGFYSGWGQPPAVDFVHVGPEERGFLLSSNYMGQGYASSRTVLLIPIARSVEEVWSLVDEQDNAGAIDPDDKLNRQVAYRASAAFKFNASAPEDGGEDLPDYYDIEVISRGNVSEDLVHLKAENWTDVYRFKDWKYRLLRHRDFVEVKKAVRKAGR